MNFRDDFLNQRQNKLIADLKAETKIREADCNLSNILLTQNQKERNKQIKKEIQKILKK